MSIVPKQKTRSTIMNEIFNYGDFNVPNNSNLHRTDRNEPRLWDALWNEERMVLLSNSK